MTITEKLTAEAEKLFEVICNMEASEVKSTIMDAEHNLRNIIDELTDQDKTISAAIIQITESIKDLKL